MDLEKSPRGDKKGIAAHRVLTFHVAFDHAASRIDTFPSRSFMEEVASALWASPKIRLSNRVTNTLKQTTMLKMKKTAKRLPVTLWMVHAENMISPPCFNPLYTHIVRGNSGNSGGLSFEMGSGIYP